MSTMAVATSEESSASISFSASPKSFSIVTRKPVSVWITVMARKPFLLSCLPVMISADLSFMAIVFSSSTGLLHRPI